MNETTSDGVGTVESVAASSGTSAPTSGSVGTVATPSESSPSPQSAQVARSATVDRINAVLNPAKPAATPTDTAVETPAAKTVPSEAVLSELGLDAIAFNALPEKVQAKLLAENKQASASDDTTDLEALAKAGEFQPPDEAKPDAAAQAQAAQTQQASQPPAAFGFDPKVMQQFAAEYPELEGPILRPMHQMAQGMVQMQQQNQQFQNMLMSLADVVTNSTAESVFGKFDGAEELYGGEDATEQQSKHRETVKNLAFALMNGAAKSNKTMTFKQALKHAHAMKNSDWIKARAEKAGIAKAQQRQASATQRAATAPTQIKADNTNWRAAAAQRISKVLAAGK